MENQPKMRQVENRRAWQWTLELPVSVGLYSVVPCIRIYLHLSILYVIIINIASEALGDLVPGNIGDRFASGTDGLAGVQIAFLSRTGHSKDPSTVIHGWRFGKVYSDFNIWTLSLVL